MNTFSMQVKLAGLLGILLVVLISSNFLLSILAEEARESTQKVNILGRQRMLTFGMSDAVNKYSSSKILLDMIKRNVLILDLYISKMRRIYTNEIYGHLKQGNDKTLKSSKPNDYPLPATFTRMVNEDFGGKHNFSLDIISSKPVNPSKSLRTPLDKKAYEFFQNNSGMIYEAIEEKQDRVIFYFYSPDRASSPNCIACHEQHTMRKIHLGDLLGMRTYKLVMPANMVSGNININPNLNQFIKFRDIFTQTLNAFKNGGEYPTNLNSSQSTTTSPLEFPKAKIIFEQIEEKLNSISKYLENLKEYSADFSHFREAQFQINSDLEAIIRLDDELLNHFSNNFNEDQNNLTFAIYLFTFGIFLWVLAISWFFNKRVLQPVSLISRTLEEMSRGDLKEKCLPECGNDELGTLVESTDRLKNSLSTYIRQTESVLNSGALLKNQSPVLGDFHDSLEKLVRIAQEKISALNIAKKANRSKSDFLSRMSHELRTPLNSIIGFSQVLLLSKNDQLTDIQTQDVKQINKSGEHLLALINEILDLSSIEAGKLNLSLEPVCFQEILNESLDLVSPLAATHKIAIENRVPSDPPIILHVDRIRLKQVLVNILSNGIKYNKPNGKVSLFLKVQDGEAIITIEDTGIGISDSIRNKVFEPFERLSDNQNSIEGSGIGLTISKHLVEIMRGSIEFKSIHGEGTSFYLKFPLSVSGLEKLNNGIMDSQFYKEEYLKAQKDHHQILYVEDNPANLQLMERIFSEIKGWDLVSTSSANEGIKLALDINPELILMDINLPEMDGIQALKILKRFPETQNIPVIAVSANAMEGQIKSAMKNGFSSYITKPIECETLIKTLEEFLKENNREERE